MKILIIDDQQHVLDDLGNELKEAQHEVYKATSLHQAQKIISTYLPDYVIIDLILDTRDTSQGYAGIEAFMCAKQTKADIKAIILSGLPFEYSRNKIKEQLIKHSKQQRDEVEKVLEGIQDNYVYKGDHKKDYIEAMFEKMGIADPLSQKTTLSWYGNYHAILIAIQNYKDHNINKLSYPFADAERLKNILTQHYAFDEEMITFIKDPTRKEIFERLDSLGNNLSSKDNLLLFYAGHGSWNDNFQQGYWLPSDANKEIHSNWVSYGDIRDFIRRINTQHTLLISDACFGGAIFKTRNDLALPKTIQEKYSKPSRRAITSGDATQTVPDRSTFLEFLINQLKDNKEKYLYAQKLYISICEEFVNLNLTNQNPVYGIIQDTGDESGGDFIFVKR